MASTDSQYAEFLSQHLLTSPLVVGQKNDDIYLALLTTVGAIYRTSVQGVSIPQRIEEREKVLAMLHQVFAMVESVPDSMLDFSP